MRHFSPLMSIVCICWTSEVKGRPFFTRALYHQGKKRTSDEPLSLSNLPFQMFLWRVARADWRWHPCLLTKKTQVLPKSWVPGPMMTILKLQPVRFTWDDSPWHKGLSTGMCQVDLVASPSQVEPVIWWTAGGPAQPQSATSLDDVPGGAPNPNWLQ